MFRGLFIYVQFIVRQKWWMIMLDARYRGTEVPKFRQRKLVWAGQLDSSDETSDSFRAATAL